MAGSWQYRSPTYAVLDSALSAAYFEYATLPPTMV